MTSKGSAQSLPFFAFFLPKYDISGRKKMNGFQKVRYEAAFYAENVAGSALYADFL